TTHPQVCGQECCVHYAVAGQQPPTSHHTTTPTQGPRKVWHTPPPQGPGTAGRKATIESSNTNAPPGTPTPGKAHGNWISHHTPAPGVEERVEELRRSQRGGNARSHTEPGS